MVPSYGKDTEIYKFEKIKRANEKHWPITRIVNCWTLVSVKTIRWPPSRSVTSWSPKSTRPKIVVTPTMESPSTRKRPRVSCSDTSAVTLDPATQINHCIGSKPAYAMLPACFINPGDVTLMTVPGYPVAGTHTRYYGGEVFKMPLLAGK